MLDSLDKLEIDKLDLKIRALEKVISVWVRRERFFAAGGLVFCFFSMIEAIFSGLTDGWTTTVMGILITIGYVYCLRMTSAQYRVISDICDAIGEIHSDAIVRYIKANGSTALDLMTIKAMDDISSK